MQLGFHSVAVVILYINTKCENCLLPSKINTGGLHEKHVCIRVDCVMKTVYYAGGPVDWRNSYVKGIQ